ncbi:MAG: hypothetical protein K2X94_03880 [Amoebophilaceae bacterium]|nr:hypothetical protein [Amoebophilaceae bacterium]
MFTKNSTPYYPLTYHQTTEISPFNLQRNCGELVVATIQQTVPLIECVQQLNNIAQQAQDTHATNDVIYITSTIAKNGLDRLNLSLGKAHTDMLALRQQCSILQQKIAKTISKVLCPLMRKKSISLSELEAYLVKFHAIVRQCQAQGLEVILTRQNENKKILYEVPIESLTLSNIKQLLKSINPQVTTHHSDSTRSSSDPLSSVAVTIKSKIADEWGPLLNESIHKFNRLTGAQLPSLDYSAKYAIDDVPQRPAILPSAHYKCRK